MTRTEPTRCRPLAHIGCRWLVCLATVILVAAFGSSVTARAASTSGKAAAVPQGFIGVNGDGPLFNPTSGLNFDRQAKAMTAAGVESMRTAFRWDTAQPYQTFSDVPAGQAGQYQNVGGVPTDFTRTDAVVGTAAKHGITILPTILYAPTWDSTPNPNGVSTPTDPRPYGAYAAALVERYGPHGSFWRSNPGIAKLPIRSWQIWNEPNIPYYWQQPFATQGYVSLLGAAHAAIKRADPRAQVVLGALTNFPWDSLGHLKGANGLYDAVSVDAFTKRPSDVLVILSLVRTAMVQLGERKKPLLATELSWPSAAGKQTSQVYPFDVNERGQARNISRLLPMLGRQRKQLGLTAFYYYTWVSNESAGPHDLPFDFAGLEGYANGHSFAKPALAAFKRAALALEQCKRKGSVATKCAKPAF